jgi:hypothetical protein
VHDAGQRRDVPGDHVGELVVLPHAHDGHEVKIPGH